MLETGRAAWVGDTCAFPVVAGARVLAAFQLVLQRQREPGADLLSMMEAVGLQVGQFMERREAERMLRRSEEQYRALFEAHPNPIWVYDLETLRFLAVNEATVRHYGYDRAELLEMTIADIRPPEDLPALMTAVQRITRGFTHSGPWHHRKKDGSVFEVEINSHTTDFAGRRAEVVLAVDVTERRALEQQLLQAQKMEAIGRLAGGVAHDFNNVALVISGHADLLLERLDDELARRSAREIRRAAEQASALTGQLLAFGRRQVLRPEELDLSAVVSDVVPMLGRLIGDDVELRASLPEGLGTVKADPAQLKQVVMNLALNARDAMPGGGRLTIETSAVHLDERLAQARLELDPGSYLVLAVTDTGEGMDEATRERVFEPFFTTKEPGKGTGLGLSTVYGVVKQSGGSIWVYSEPGHGTTFKVYLPRHGAAARAPAPREAESMPRRAAGRVLFVEDHEQVRTLVHIVLEQLGYTVLVASNGGEALAQVGVHTDTLDVLITDLIMPGMSGRELADRLRADRPGTRVLFTSGYTQDMLGEGLGPGEAYLQKPYDQAELARALEELLEAGER